MKQNTWLMLVLILSGWILAGFYCAVLPNNEDKKTDSKVKTSYQFNIIHMTDSIKVYDGSRYVGQCAEKDLETLILNDNQ